MKRIYFALVLVGAVIALCTCSRGINTDLDSSTRQGGGMPDPNSLFTPIDHEHVITDPLIDCELQPFNTTENLQKE